MKSATFPSLRVDPKLRSAAEQVLEEGETLSSFVEQSIRDGVQRRQAQREFIARGLKARDSARVAKTVWVSRLRGLFEIESDDIVTVLAIRHQREDDYF